MDHINILKRAYSRFSEGLEALEDDLDRDGVIQRFEHTFELVWKTLKISLEKMGLRATSPKDIFRIAAREGFIADPKVWFVFLELRNLASHVYREEYAKKVADSFVDFKNETEKVIGKLEVDKKRKD